MNNNGACVRDYMIVNSPMIRCGTSIDEVISVFERSGMGGAPVVNDNNAIVGFVSEHDCIKKLLHSSYYCDGIMHVNDVMHNEVLSVSPDMSIQELAERMTKKQPKIYPVVEDGKLLGVITRGRVMQALATTIADCAQTGHA
ncbi:CBS domain-containing protein [Marinibactrum halimedae]|uniref:CBS domain-containing protein n=1 Tax=Marinibactrum halimedae TaxID=1444977 RepID=A0AA37WM65_9GAMM|nr:CBS domain-containing protein [Marinibactrum halimedae]MCD9458635.1 CBS domain-containing protein [Marinibactrum halimedae]GLS26000.1 CBS domain-containing protein [Marinibactrum halimedae]